MAIALQPSYDRVHSSPFLNAMQKPSIGAWTPASTVTRHGRDIIPEDMYFFVAPPPTIGEVMTADSSLRTPSLPHPDPLPPQHIRVLSRTIHRPVVFVFLICLGLFILKLNLILFLVLIAHVGIGVLLTLPCRLYIQALQQPFEPDSTISAACSYVGDRGIAEFTLPKENPDHVNTSILLFENATALYVIYHLRSQGTKTKRYSYTNYTYRWHRQDSTDFSIYGKHGYRTEPPDVDNRWHFGRAAEAMWTRYQLKLATQRINQGESIEFPVLREQWRPIEIGGGRDLKMVRVNSNYLEFVDKSGDKHRFKPDQITHATARVNDKFRFTGQNLLSLYRDCRYSAPYGDMANAELLIACLDRFLGITCK